MKKFVITAACLLLGLPGLASAQDQSQYVELLRQDIVTQKTAILTEAMDLNAEQSDKFWPIVREYDVKRAEIADRRIAAIKKYAANYEMMTPDSETVVISVKNARVSPDASGRVTVAPRLFVGFADGKDTLPLGERLWRDTRIELPAAGAYVNVFTGERLHAEEGEKPALALSAVLADFPVALLERIESRS